ncbi:MAG: hypothetical protein Q9183_002254 [Haloplaca sp. 2 TL-2023]
MSVCRGGVWRWTKAVYRNSNPHTQAFPTGLKTCRVRATWGHRLQSTKSTAPPNGSTPGFDTSTSGHLYGDNKDIYVDDLQATLEAHRATNRARAIRRVVADSDPSVFRPDLPEPHQDLDVTLEDASEPRASGNHAESPVGAPSEVEDNVEDIEHLKTTEKYRLKPWEFWPIGSTQYRKLRGISHHMRTQGPAEYQATVFEPSGNSGIGQKVLPQHCPWLGHMQGEVGGDALQRLGHEITAYERCMTASDSELQATRKVAKRINQLVKSTLEGSSCEVIGSHSTGLALPSSDIDFSVSLPAVEADATLHRKSLRGLRYQKAYRQALIKLQTVVRSDPEFGGSAEVVFASVPILRAVHRVTKQEVQIQMWAGNRRQEQYTLAYLAEYPTLRPLYFVLRSSLKIRKLGYTLEGGLGAYATLMMIVNVLKHASGHYDPLDVGNQLLHVLQFYAEADLYRYGWAVDPPRQLIKGNAALHGSDNVAKTNPKYPYLLYLQDPADAANDLGSKSYGIKHIQSTFANIRNGMLQRMQQWESEGESDSRSTSNVTLLAPLGQAQYRSLQSQRVKMREYASSTVKDQWCLGKRERLSAESTGRQKQKVSVREMLGKVREVETRKAAEKAKALSYLSTDRTRPAKEVRGVRTKKPGLSWGELYYKKFVDGAQRHNNNNASKSD